MTETIEEYLKPRKGTLLWLNKDQFSRLKNNLKIENRESIDLENPCLIWKKRGDARMTFQRKKYYLANFIYKYCIGELKNNERVIQICPNDKKCLQPSHLRPKKGAFTKKYNFVEESQEYFEKPDLKTIEEAEKMGKVLEDSQGRVFLSLDTIIMLATKQSELQSDLE